MIDSFDNKNLAAKVCKNLPALVDDYYERAEKLSRMGWEFFEVSLRAQECICTYEDVQLERKLRREIWKEYVGHGAYRSKELEERKREAEQRYQQTKYIWDQLFLPCDRRMRELNATKDESSPQLLNNFRAEVTRLLAKNIDQHGDGLYKKYEEDSKVNRIKLYREVMARISGAIGFSYDKKLSTSTNPIFTKAFLPPWKLAFVTEYPNLVQGVGDAYSPATQSSLEFSFGLVHEKSKGVSFARKGDYLQFGCQYFFPVNEHPFANMYKSFKTLLELESIIHLHIDMYKIIQTEFESALYEGLQV